MENDLENRINVLEQKMREHYHNGVVGRRINAYDIDGLKSSSKSYSGYVNSDGSVGHLPSGWTSAKTGTGQYTVTHNLGTASYGTSAMAVGTAAVPHFNSVNVNDVQLVWQDSKTQSLGDTQFYFVLIPF